MKTMARKRLSGLARLSLAFIVALTLAAPYSGTIAYATENTPNSSGDTNLDLVAYSSNAKAYSSLDEAKAALETANQNKADAEASKNEAQKVLDTANASYNQAASAHDEAVKAAESAKAQADAAVGDAIRATQQEVQRAEAHVSETYDGWMKAVEEQKQAEKNLATKTEEYTNAKQTYERMIAEKNDATLNQKKAELDQAQQALDEATKKLGENKDNRLDLDKQKTAAKEKYEAAKTKADNAAAAVTTATQKVTSAQSALDSAKAALAAAPKDETATYEQAVATAQAKVNTASQEKATAESNLATAKSELSAAQSQLSKAQEDLTNAKNNSSEEPQEIKNLRAAVKQAQEAYDQAKETNGATKGYAEAEQDKKDAEKALEDARADANTALQNYRDAVDQLAQLSPDEATSFNVPDSIDEATSSVSTADDSSSDITTPPSDEGEDPGTNPDDPGNTGEVGNDEPTLTDEEKINEAKSNALTMQQNFNTAMGVVREKDSALATATAVFNAADKCKTEEELLASAQRELANALAALPPAENYEDPNHPLQIAINNALTLVGEKSTLVTTRNGELADKATALTNAESELKRAQDALTNYHAPDNSRLEANVTKAEEALAQANTELANAETEATTTADERDQLMQEFNDLDQQYQAAVTTENDHQTLVVKPKTIEYNYALEDFRNVARPVFGADYSELSRLMNRVNGDGGLRDQVNSAEAAIPRKEKEAETARTIYNEAGLELGYAKNKLINLAKAENRSILMNDEEAWNSFKANPSHEYYTNIEDVILNPYSVDPDNAEEGSYMAVLNTHAGNVTAAREAAQPFKDHLDAADAERTNAANSFNAANANYEYAAAEVAEIEEIIRNWNDGQQNGDSSDPSNSDEPNVYTPSSKPTTKPAAKPASNGKATVHTADKKTPAKDEAVAEQTDEQAAEETVITTSQEQRTPVQPKAWTFFGVDPLIAGIVGGAILIAAVAAIAAAVVRHRRNTAEAAESEE